MDDIDRPVTTDHPVPGVGAGAGDPTRPSRRATRVLLVRGVMALVLGLTLLVEGWNLSRLTTFIAVYWILAALVTLRWVGVHRELPHRPVGVIAGAIGLVVGLVVLVRPLIDELVSDGVLLDILGASAIVTGVLRLSGLIHDDQVVRDHPRARYRFVVGTAEVLLGVVVMLSDKGATDVIRFTASVWGLATGTFLLLDAAMLRRSARAGLGDAT